MKEKEESKKRADMERQIALDELRRSYRPVRERIMTEIRERRLELARFKDDGCPN